MKIILRNYVFSLIFFINFLGEEGLLFEGVRKKPEKYLQPCSNGVKDWLMELKGDNRVVFLMTSSKNRYAEMVLETVLG